MIPADGLNIQEALLLFGLLQEYPLLGVFQGVLDIMPPLQLGLFGGQDALLLLFYSSTFSA